MGSKFKKVILLSRFEESDTKSNIELILMTFLLSKILLYLFNISVCIPIDLLQFNHHHKIKHKIWLYRIKKKIL